MVDALYQKSVKETFEKKPLRTVLMIDDQFPTLADMAAETSEEVERQYPQKDLAVSLYRAFRKNDMICDIDNVADHVNSDLIRKSDLVILDYHLGPGPENYEKSIAILRELASSKHFNTVVLYTAETDLNEVWLQVIASLGGAWTTLPGELEGSARHHWEDLLEREVLPKASKTMMMEFARRRNVDGLSPETAKQAQDELIGLGVPQSGCREIIDAMINVEMAELAGAEYQGAPRRLAVGNYANGRPWIQSQNTFITILTKKTELTDDEKDPAGILACLNEALLGWRPNLIQVVISEIQNVLELDALVSEDELLREPTTQTALWYFLLSALEPIDPQAPPDVRVPLSALIDRIIEGVRRRLSTDRELLELASEALIGELRHEGWTKKTWPAYDKLYDSAVKMSRSEGMVEKEHVFFRLNSFLTTEAFQRSHLMTGALIKGGYSNELYVVASPACDLVPRLPSSEQPWTRGLHPWKPIVCIRLHPHEKTEAALRDATRGKFIFLENNDGRAIFSLIKHETPSFEVLFAQDAGVISEKAGKQIFSAKRVMPQAAAPAAEAEQIATKSISELQWKDEEFEVIGQLRPANADRVLQLMGQHLSRIGLDFIGMPKT